MCAFELYDKKVQYPNWNLIQPYTDTKAWEALIRERYDIPEGEEIEGNHHVLFFNELKGTLMQALHDLNGGKGDPSDYEYYVNILINVEDLAADDTYGLLLNLGQIDPITGEYESTFTNDISNWNNNIGGYEGFTLSCN